MESPIKNKLADAVAKLRIAAEARKQAELAKELERQREMKHIPLAAKPELPTTPAPETTEQTPAPAIVWNSEQLRAIELSATGEAFCLIGAAGTGKTTTVKEVVSRLMQQLGGNLQENELALVSYTRRAVRNLAKAVTSIGATRHCKTIHKLLEYQPEYFEYEDENGQIRKTMRFVPNRGATNPINECKLIVVDESSMVDVRLFQQLEEACPNATFIFIGDLNQLPPVFGDAILGHKLNELPVVELKQVYRQAMESPIIWFQHEYTLAGKVPTDTELAKISKEKGDKGLKFRPFKKNDPDGEVMAEAVASYMCRLLEDGTYCPTQDTILIPFNKSFGSIHINLHIAEYLARKNTLEVWEIFAGFNRHYFAVSDFVMYNKEECRITNIEVNSKYWGPSPMLPSTHLTRFGYMRGSAGASSGLDLGDPSAVDFDKLLEATANETAEEKVQQASHKITLEVVDSGEIVYASTVGEVNSIDFGYAMTIHKSQGSQWRKVWLVLAKHHKGMLTREILYTGMTRAQEEVEVIYTPQTAPGRRDNSAAKAISKQSIPGKTWQQKAAYFMKREEVAAPKD